MSSSETDQIDLEDTMSLVDSKELNNSTSETDSDLSLSEDSDSSSEEDTIPQPHNSSRPIRERGRVRTRGGLQRTTNQRNDWLDWASALFNPIIPSFTRIHGPKIDLPDTVKGFVHNFLTDELIDDIVAQTNLYAEDFLANAPLSNAKSQHR